MWWASSFCNYVCVFSLVSVLTASILGIKQPHCPVTWACQDSLVIVKVLAAVDSIVVGFYNSNFNLKRIREMIDRLCKQKRSMVACLTA